MRSSVRCSALSSWIWWVACLVCTPFHFTAAGAEAAETGAVREDGSPVAGAIGFYQRYISALRQTHCPFDPSCSQFAMEALGDRGLLAGSALACDRLMRCNRSAAGYYARGPNHRLVDPVQGAPPRLLPRVPSWVVPTMDFAPPADLAGSAREDASFATALAQDGECERAGTEFRRAAHAAGIPGMAAWAHLRSGACFYANERWELAADEFRRASEKATSHTERNAALLLGAACRFNDGDFAAAEAVALEADSTSGSDGASLELLGLCDMATGRWTSARHRFATALDSPAGEAHPAKLRYLLDQTTHGEHLPHRSPGLAATFSAVLPGAGQAYCGRWQDGLRHLIFNGALIYTIVELARREQYPAAYLVAAIELPFYLGNIIGAQRAARAFDRKARLSFVSSVLDRTEH